MLHEVNVVLAKAKGPGVGPESGLLDLRVWVLPQLKG